MSLSLVPARVFSSYAAVTPEYLADRGVRLLLSDLDFTLAPKSCPAPDEAVRAWIASMQRAGIEVMILSNNRSPVRVERFCKDLGHPLYRLGQKAVAAGLPPCSRADGRSRG